MAILVHGLTAQELARKNYIQGAWRLIYTVRSFEPVSTCPFSDIRLLGLRQFASACTSLVPPDFVSYSYHPLFPPSRCFRLRMKQASPETNFAWTDSRRKGKEKAVSETRWRNTMHETGHCDGSCHPGPSCTLFPRRPDGKVVLPDPREISKPREYFQLSRLDSR